MIASSLKRRPNRKSGTQNSRHFRFSILEVSNQVYEPAFYIRSYDAQVYNYKRTELSNMKFKEKRMLREQAWKHYGDIAVH